MTDLDAGETPAKAAPAVEPEPSAPLPPWAVDRSPRRSRPARAPLDRGQIVDVALRIVDLEGAAELSLRRLADELGVTPMSIYWHVRDKAELLELVGYAVLDGIEIPPPVGDWRTQLREIHRAMFDGFLRHPNTADILIARARYGASGLRLFERILAILLEGGFSSEAAFDAYQSLYVFTLGSMAMASRTAEFRAIQQEGVAYLLTLPTEQFPAIRTVAPVIGRRSFGEQFEIGLTIQIEGIAKKLAARG